MKTLKRKSKWWCLLLIVVVLCLCSTALAYQDATQRITIFTQNNYTSTSNWSLRGSQNPTTLKAAGCHLFSYAHAYQWLANTKCNDNLLRELISVCRNPSDGPNSGKATEDKEHTYCGGVNGASHSNSTNAYNAWMRSKLGSDLIIKSSSDAKALVNSESSLKAFYDNGGVIISNPGGHYVVSVGYQVYNGETYIHIVDSSRWTTIHTDGKTAYSFNDIRKSATYSPNKGDQFWVKWTTYKGFRHDNAFSLHINQVILPERIELDKTTDVLYLDSTMTLVATVYPSNANKSITWTTSNPSVATVNNGIVTPTGTGMVTITAASTVAPNEKAACDIEVKYNGTGMIKFNSIIVPYRYKINSNGFSWESGSGSITSDVNLKEVYFTLVHPNGSSYTWRYPTNTSEIIGAKQLNMTTVNSIIKFSQISSTGQGYFEIRAIDIAGRSLAKGRIIQVSTTEGVTKSTDSTCTNTQYRIITRIEEPQLKDSTTLNGHRYERYFATYSWTDAKLYAERVGGHLATISSAEENAAIFSLVNKDSDFGAWIGAYRDGTTWKWVNEDEPFIYTNWNTSDGEPNGQWNLENYGAMMRTAGKWRDSALNNYAWKYFIVEYEPVLVSEILISGETAPIVGDTFTVSATILPDNAENKGIVYSSSNTTIATVDAQTGIVTAIQEGEVVISAAAQDGSGVIGQYSLYVNRRPVPVIGIHISANEDLYSAENTVTVEKGDSFIINVMLLPADADNQGVYFYSTDDETATIDDSNNTVITKTAGTCEIIAVSVDGEYTDSINVIVLPNSGSCGDNTTWEYSNGKLTIAGTGPMYDYQWGAAPWYQYRNEITTVELSAGLTSVGDYAFFELGSASIINVPDTVRSIGVSSFRNTAITSIHIPNGVTTIPYDCFDGCTSLESVIIPDSVTTIGYRAFEDCHALTSINIPASVIAIDVPTSGDTYTNTAFCKDENVTIYCYEGSVAKAYAIEKGIPYIRIDVGADRTLPDGDYFICSAIKPQIILDIDGVEVPAANGTTVFLCDYGEAELATQDFDKWTLTYLDNGFYAIKQFGTEMALTVAGNSKEILADIQVNAYIGSTGQQWAIEPTAYGYRLRARCSGFSADIQGGVDCIQGGTNVLQYNQNEGVYAQNQSWCFLSVGGICGENLTWRKDGTTVTISGTGPMYDYEQIPDPWRTSAPWGSNVTSVIIEDGVTSVGGFAFYFCENLSSVVLPTTLKSIGAGSFEYCTGLTMFNIPNGVETIGITAFSWCNALQSVTIPASVDHIGDGAFCNCFALQTITVASENPYYYAIDNVLISRDGVLVAYPITKTDTEYTVPDGTVVIGWNAFANVNNLKIITLPASVITIVDDAFVNCTFEKIKCYAGTAAHIYAKANGFSYFLMDTTFTNPDFKLPASSQSIEAEAFEGIAARRVLLSETTTAIQSRAFAECPNLVCIYIPEACTSIANDAFSNVNNLTIFSQDGSYAEFFANKHGFNFVAISE